MTQPQEATQAMLARVLREEQPRSYLVLGDPDPLNPDPDEVAAETVPVPTRYSLAEAVATLSQLGRQDLVLVAGLQALPRGDGEVLLSRLRDLYARRVLVTVVLDGEWQRNDMTAFGFTQLARIDEHLGTLFGFDIATYKTTPDWLNPRYWANPEMWDKAWW